MTSPRTVRALTGAALLVLAACGTGTDVDSTTAGDPATWELRQDVTESSQSLDIGVTRLGCASGVTGEVLQPRVTYEAEQIIIEVDVAPIGDGAQDCQGNDAVPLTVTLDEPVGERRLVDGACLGGEAATTSSCASEVRWP